MKLLRPNIVFRYKLLIAVGVSFFIAFIFLAVTYWGRETVVQFPIKGHPGKSVDFVLCDPMVGKRGWIVRFGGAETKDAFVLGDVTKENIKANARIEYDGETLMVFGPGGEQMTVYGFSP